MFPTYVIKIFFFKAFVTLMMMNFSYMEKYKDISTIQCQMNSNNMNFVHCFVVSIGVFTKY